MVRTCVAALALAACAFSPGAAIAMPFDAASIAQAARAADPVEDVRLFCYNRFNGRFLHWGGCGRPIVYYRPRYRIVCRNRFTGRFLHWGYC